MEYINEIKIDCGENVTRDFEETPEDKELEEEVKKMIREKVIGQKL